MKSGRIAAVMLSLAMCLTACQDGKSSKEESSLPDSSQGAAPFFDEQGNAPTEEINTENTAAERVSDKASKKDLDDSFSEADSEKISLAEKSGDIVISEAGTYIVSGETKNGRLVVDAPDDADVKIVLSGVSVTSEDSCCIYVKNADNVVLTLAEGTKNTLCDSSQYVYDDTQNEEPSACIFSKDDLAINGAGSLEIKANFHNAIESKDDLVLVNGRLSITAVNVGVKGKDSVTVLGGEYEVNSGADSLKASNDKEADKGWIVINGGTLKLSSGGDAVSSATDLTITGGSIDVTTKGEVQASENNDFGFGFDKDTQTEDTNDLSSKGVKSGTGMYISGGKINVSSTDHAVHSGGDMVVCGGETVISSLVGKGICAHGNLLISDGKITVTKSTEGIESKAVLSVTGGEISVAASDDGLNAGGGNSMKGGWQTQPEQDSQTHLITISGGVLSINAGGDGIDSNGDLYISGGVVSVWGPTNSGNGILDCGDSRNIVKIDGGEVFAVGSMGMMEMPDSSSSQNTIVAQCSAGKGDVLLLTDDSGNIVMSLVLQKQIQGAVISSPQIETGKSYTLYVSQSQSSAENAQQAGTAEISSAITTIGNVSPGMGGMGGHGGGMQKPDNGGMPPDGFGGGRR